MKHPSPGMSWTFGISSLLGTLISAGAFRYLAEKSEILGAHQMVVIVTILLVVQLMLVYFWLFLLPRFAPKVGMWHLKWLYSSIQRAWPSDIPNYHKNLRKGWKKSLDFLNLNRRSAWLLPPITKNYIKVHGIHFFRLQLAEWDQIVSDIADYDNPLYNAQFIFITWDLRSLSDYTEETTLALSGMLNALTERVTSSELLIHRILVIDIETLLLNRKRFFLDIWLSYFQYAPPNYKFHIIDGVALESAIARNQQEGILDSFLDVAFFSNQNTTRVRARNELLPTTSANSIYTHCQFSRQLFPAHPFTSLHIAKDRALIDHELENSKRVLAIGSTIPGCNLVERIRREYNNYIRQNKDEVINFFKETISSSVLKNSRRHLVSTIPMKKGEIDLPLLLNTLESDGMKVAAAPGLNTPPTSD